MLPDCEDPEEYRDKAVRMSQGALVEEKVRMSEEEKKTRTFILSHGVTEDSYSYSDYVKIPQQDSMS